MDINKLLKYEMWSIAEWVSWDWLQNILARLVANKVNRKLRRYNKRTEREKYFESLDKPLTDKE